MVEIGARLQWFRRQKEIEERGEWIWTLSLQAYFLWKRESYGYN